MLTLTLTFVSFQDIYASALNDVVGLVTLNGGVAGTVTAVLIESSDTEPFSDMDGLCTFGSNYYRLRSGEVKTDSAGFVSSWK